MILLFRSFHQKKPNAIATIAKGAPTPIPTAMGTNVATPSVFTFALVGGEEVWLIGAGDAVPIAIVASFVGVALSVPAILTIDASPG